MVIQEMLQLSIELKMKLDLFGTFHTFRPAYPLSQLPETDSIITILYLHCIKYNFRFIFAIFYVRSKIYVQMCK